LDALVRGYPIDGETCELVGYGPVPVATITAMIESGNPFLVAIATKGTDVVSVAHLGHNFTAAQVSAMQWRDPTCAVLAAIGSPDWRKTTAATGQQRNGRAMSTPTGCAASTTTRRRASAGR